MGLIIEGYLGNIIELHLQHNSITDFGFGKVIRIIKSVHETKCPRLVRLGLESNLVTTDVKRKYSPFPPYISV